MTLNVSVGGVHKRATAIWVSVGGVWKRVLAIDTTVSSVFKEFFYKFYALSSAWSAEEFTVGSYADVTATFQSGGGVEYTSGEPSSSWVDPTEAGVGAQFYIYLLRLTGNPARETGAARNTMLALASSRSFGLQQITWGGSTATYTAYIYRYNGVSAPVYGVDTPVATGSLSLSCESEP